MASVPHDYSGLCYFPNFALNAHPEDLSLASLKPPTSTFLLTTNSNNLKTTMYQPSQKLVHCLSRLLSSTDVSFVNPSASISISSRNPSPSVLYSTVANMSCGFQYPRTQVAAQPPTHSYNSGYISYESPRDQNFVINGQGVTQHQSSQKDMPEHVPQYVPYQYLPQQHTTQQYEQFSPKYSQPHFPVQQFSQQYQQQNNFQLQQYQQHLQQCQNQFREYPINPSQPTLKLPQAHSPALQTESQTVPYLIPSVVQNTHVELQKNYDHPHLPCPSNSVDALHSTQHGYGTRLQSKLNGQYSPHKANFQPQLPSPQATQLPQTSHMLMSQLCQPAPLPEIKLPPHQNSNPLKPAKTSILLRGKENISQAKLNDNHTIRATRHKQSCDNRLSTRSSLQDPSAKFSHLVEIFHDWKEKAELQQKSSNTPTEPVSALMLSELGSVVVILKETKVIHLLRDELLLKLTAALTLQIRQAAHLKASTQCENYELVDDSTNYLLVMSGMEAAVVCLHVMTSDNVSKKVLDEEVLEAILDLCKFQLRNYVFPFYDPNFTVSEDDNIDKEDKKKPKSKHKKHLQHPSEMLFRINEILQLIYTFISVNNRDEPARVLHDNLVLDITAITLPFFFVEGITNTQMLALSVVQAIFSRYPKHRILILDQILNDLSKLPKTKRNLRLYHLNHNSHDYSINNKSIQIISALVMQLIQTSPGFYLDSEKNVQQNSVSVASECTSHFIGVLLKNCASSARTSTAASRDSNYHQILQNLVEDLLCTLYNPEWPASEMLLILLCEQLVEVVVKKKENSESIRLTAIKLLGQITSHMHRLAIFSVVYDIFNTPPEKQLNADGKVDGETESNCDCVCRTRTKENREPGFSAFTGTPQDPMMDCDRCHRWFHCSCVGVLSSAIPNCWLCDNCVFFNQMKKIKEQWQDPLAPPTLYRKNNDCDDIHAGNDRVDESDDEDDNTKKKLIETTAKELILNYFSKLLHNCQSNTLDDARRFTISSWFEEDEDTSNRQYYVSKWKLEQDPSALTLSPAGTAALLLYLSSNSHRTLLPKYGSSASASFSSIFSGILHVLEESQPKNRTKAIKALASIVEADPRALVSDPRILPAISARLWDLAISVREAAVDLIGRYIVFKPEVAEQFYGMIEERLLDRGLSVRKRVVSISRTLCKNSTDNNLIVRVCVNLVSRFHEEDSSIKELVVKTLSALWFRARLRQSDANDDDKELQRKTTQIVEVVGIMSEKGNTTWLSEILTDMRKRDNADTSDALKIKGKVKKHIQLNISDVCTQVCACIVRRLCELKRENDTKQIQSASTQKSSTVTTTSTATKPKSLLVMYFTTLRIISSVCPESVVHHVKELAPYLKPGTVQDPDVAIIFQNVAQIVEHVFSLMKVPPDQSLAETLTKDLTYLMQTQGMPVIQSSVKCLCTLAHLLHQQQQQQSIFQTYYSYLRTVKDPTVKPAQVQAQVAVVRALYILGNLCRYHRFGELPKNVNDLQTLKSIKYDPHVENLFIAYLSFWKNKDINIQVVALMGIGLLFVSYPGIVIRATDVIKSALSGDANVRLKQQALTTLEEFLRDEAELMSTASKEYSTITSTQSSSTEPEKTTDADTGVGGIIFQQFLTDILGRVFDRDSSIRMSAVTLVMAILKRSLIHPIQCVEHLVAIQADHTRKISELAYHCLLNVHSKDSKIILTRLSNGIVLSYSYQNDTFGSWKVVMEANTDGIAERESIFGKLYNMFKTTKTTRHAFLHTFVRLFELESTNFNFLKYLTICLGTLPFSYVDDLLYVIYHLNRIISFTGASLLSNLEGLYAVKKRGKKSTTDVAPQEVKQVVGVIYVLRLKAFLKNFYTISGSACKNYDPASITDAKLTAVLTTTQVELTDISSVVTLDEINFGTNWWDDTKQCKDLVVLLKDLMKNDENDFSSCTVTGRGPKRGRKRAGNSDNSGSDAGDTSSHTKKRQRKEKSKS